MIVIPPINVMIVEVERYIYMKTGVKVNIVFNMPFEVNRHVDMLKDAYKIIKKDGSK